MPARLASSCSSVEQRPLLGLAARVADDAGAAAGHGDGPVPGLLEPPQGAQLRAGARRGGCRRSGRSRCRRSAARRRGGRQPGVGHLVDQPPEAEVLDEVGHATACHAAASRGRTLRSPCRPDSRGRRRQGRGPDGEPVSRRQLRPGARGADRRPRPRRHRCGPARPRGAAAAQRAEPGASAGRPGRLPLVLGRRDGPRRLAGRGQGHRLPQPLGPHPGRWPPRWPPSRPRDRASRSTDRPTPT